MAEIRFLRGADRRQHMIVETERFLTRHLPSSHSRTRPQSKRVNHDNTSPVRMSDKVSPTNGKPKNKQSTTPPGVWIEPSVGRHGELDEERLQILITRLYESARFSPGDILIDLTDVRRVPPTFQRVMDALERYLADQSRHLFILKSGTSLNGEQVQSSKQLLA